MKDMNTEDVRQKRKALCLIASAVLSSIVAGCSEQHHGHLYEPPSASTAPVTANSAPVTASSAASEVNISSFPVWARNEYKAEQYLGKSKTAMVSALGAPVSVEGGADDHSDISNKRLAYIYAGDEGSAPQNTEDHQVQVYFADDGNTPLTVAVLGLGPTVGDILTYLCGPDVMPTDLYCVSNENADSESYVYGKTRQGHRFILTLDGNQNSVIANYSKTFNAATNQYTAGIPTLNMATWRQARSRSFCVFNNPNDVKPGAPLYVSRWFRANGGGGLTHIKLD